MLTHTVAVGSQATKAFVAMSSRQAQSQESLSATRNILAAHQKSLWILLSF